MLEITIGGKEMYDEATQTFVLQGGTTVHLEHSLVSMSKWESKFEKPFLGKEDKTTTEVLAYINEMVIGKVPEGFLEKLNDNHMLAINEYIEAKQTATWFRESPGSPATREVITSELVYYWLVAFNIPFECQNWHLNRLFTLIRICNLKSAKPKKMGRGEAAARQRELNAQRRTRLGSNG